MPLLRNQGPWKASENRLRRLNSQNIWFNPGGNLYSWGYNVYNDLGQGDAVYRSNPTQIPGADWKQLAFQGYNSHAGMAIKNDDSLWAWGYNVHGSLGLGDTVQRNYPVQSNAVGPWKKIVLASSVAHGLKPDNTLWAWGYNPYGNLGQNDAISRSSPIQIPGEWSDIGLSHYGSFGIKTDGTLWSWGINSSGQLGHNDDPAIKRSSPTQIGTRSDWRKVFNCKYHNGAAITTDGAFYNWGYNGNADLGQNDTVTRSSPTLLLGQSGVELFDLGSYHNAAAVKSDTSLSVWGNGTYGNNGQNDIVPRSNPIQIAGGDWMQPCCSHDTAVVKRDGSQWSWGYMAYGLYGNNTTSSPWRSSPVNMTGGWRSYDNVIQNGVNLHESPVAQGGQYHRYALTNPLV